MSLYRWFPPLAAALASVAAIPTAASAVELIEGGSGAASLLGTDAAAMLAADGALDETGDGTAVLLDFTPRGAGLVAGERAGAPRIRFELGVADPAAGNSLGDSLAGGDLGPSWLDEPGRDGERQLSLGGALSWSEWTVGGSIGRGALLAGGADLVSATVGYGSLTASLTYGQADGSAPGAGAAAGDDVLMLSTDLTAWSWLTLQSDLAVRSDKAEDEQEAVGRLGVRLSF